MRSLVKLVTAAAVALSLAACGDNDSAVSSGTAGTPAGSDSSSGAAEQVPGNIVQVAQATPNLSLLVEAVVAADLVDALSGPGPFTVFAPTNDAFVSLLDELEVSKDALFAQPELLRRVLTYHVVSGSYLAAEVPLETPITTLQGGTITVDVNLSISDEQARLARITATDVTTSNGVVHIIDKVILPADMQAEPEPLGNSIVDIAAGNPDFSILVEAVNAAGLADTLSTGGPFTVFAPTNAAFAALLEELNLSKEALFSSTQTLQDFLLYHVLNGAVLAAEIPIGAHLTTAQGGNISITADLLINDNLHRQSMIIATDIEADNGVIHAVGQVLRPY